MDYQNKPYSKWLDDMIIELFDMDPASIAIVAINKDGTTATTYFNMHNGDRATAIRSMLQDSILEYVRLNADLIVDLLREEIENIVNGGDA